MTIMADEKEFRALVVDDDAVVRRMVSFALQQEGFQCETAIDGEQALTRLAQEPYDLLVTDLRMPNKHGHALAVDVLAGELRPTIIVHSSVDDARLTKDLIIRGVDDVVYKPTNYEALAAKAKGMVIRDRKQAEQPNERDQDNANAIDTSFERKAQSTSETPDELRKEHATDQSSPDKNRLPANDRSANTVAHRPVETSEMKERLADVSKALPVSQTAANVANMVISGKFDSEQVAATIHRDPAVEARVLQLANQRFYNPSGERITDVKQAVSRIGQLRTGELTLATSAFLSISPDALPWLDVELTWRQSVAAGIALELLVKAGKHAAISEGTLFSTLLHSAGRVVLGSHYPQYYDSMVSACTKYSQPLMMYEEQMFPQTYADVMCGLLADWKIPENFYAPLKYILRRFATLSSLPEPMRTKVELVKMAILIGRIAIGRWETWELVDIPLSSVPTRLGIQSVPEIIAGTREQLPGIPRFGSEGQAIPETTGQREANRRSLYYINLSDEAHDFLADIVSSMGIELGTHHFKNGKGSEHVLINRIGVAGKQVRSNIVASVDCENIVIVRNSPNLDGTAGLAGPGIELPCSFARLQSACWNAAREA